MRFLYYCFFSFFLTNNLTAQVVSSSNSDKIEYNVIGDFSSNDYFSLDLTPFRSMIYGNYLNIGAGGALGLYNIAQRFSIEGEFIYNYGYAEILSSNCDFGLENYDKKSAKEFGGTLSYNISSSKKLFEENYVHLKDVKNISYYTTLPAKQLKIYSVQFGYKSIGMYNLSNPTFTSSYYDAAFDTTYTNKSEKTVRSFFQNSSIYVGVKFSKIINTKYSTAKFGNVQSDHLNEIYGGILVGFKPSFPQIYRYYYDSFKVNEISEAVQIPVVGQMEYENDFKFLPVGFKAGVSLSGKSTSGAMFCELALYPGYNRSIFQQLSLRAGLSIRIMRDFSPNVPID